MATPSTQKVHAKYTVEWFMDTFKMQVADSEDLANVIDQDTPSPASWWFQLPSVTNFTSQDLRINVLMYAAVLLNEDGSKTRVAMTSWEEMTCIITGKELVEGQSAGVSA